MCPPAEKRASAGGCMTQKPFARFRAAVQKLVGGRPFGKLVSPIEFFDLAELQLVATHPSPNPRDQWAEFRDPTGKVHRVWLQPSDCCEARPQRRTHVRDLAHMLDVTSTSVTLPEYCLDPVDGVWFERATVIKKVGVP